MKKLLVALVALTCVFMFSLDNASAKNLKKKFSPVARLSHSGDIQGTIQFGCTDTTASEALIYLEGESFVVKTSLTDTDNPGAFRFYNVPSGPHKLVIELQDQDPSTKNVVVVATKTLDVPVTVTPKTVTVLDPIPVDCP